VPAYFPEGNTPVPDDTEWRSLQKWAHLLFLDVGSVGCAFYPEGSEPLVGDNEERLMVKINAMR
jgi:hypothetical protein